ncbi:MAG TPA: cbb3-type cytochrome c oxidase subunit II [Vicinamibacterales bacterium]|nr:cbb3-type cytochrome c oxidase subunit II [Vicinamibacterales bacterium]
MTDRPQRALRMSYIVASVAGVVFFAMSVGLLGLWPKRVLDAQAKAMGPEYALPLSDSARRGRHVYSREGCAYCHTQQVRYLHADMARFGAPVLAWETRPDTPHLWGTRRIGPDLARAGGTRPQDWQFAHLFSPRAMVPDSVMPPYRALFDGAPHRPRQEARDLVAYLESLGRARELDGPDGEKRAREGCNCPDDAMTQMAFGGTLNAHPARARRSHEAASLPLVNDLPRGQRLFARHCATCHGADGAGDGVGGATLRPRPRNLTEHEYSTARLADVLWNGVFGAAMPAWRDHSPEDRAAMAQAVRALAVPQQEPNLPPHMAELGARTYAANCVQCHGVRGDGDGPAAAELPMAPVSFRRQRPSVAHAIEVLRNGIDGTSMAPWTSRLTDAELLAVADYVRGFYAGALETSPP